MVLNIESGSKSFALAKPFTATIYDDASLIADRETGSELYFPKRKNEELELERWLGG